MIKYIFQILLSIDLINPQITSLSGIIWSSWSPVDTSPRKTENGVASQFEGPLHEWSAQQGSAVGNRILSSSGLWALKTQCVLMGTLEAANRMSRITHAKTWILEFFVKVKRLSIRKILVWWKIWKIIFQLIKSRSYVFCFVLSDICFDYCYIFRIKANYCKIF